MIIASSEWTSVGQALGGLAAFCGIIILPSAIFFHKRVIKPLRWVLGIAQEDSPTGEEILPIPQQLAQLRTGYSQMRSTQVELKGDIAKMSAEMFPNGGTSLRDSVNRNETLTKEIKVKVIDLESSVKDVRTNQATTAILAVKTAKELAEFTAKQNNAA